MPREPTGNPNGKPPFEPTDEERQLVELMTAVGIAQESVALVMRDGIDVKTLRKHFRQELDTATVKANAKIAGALFNKAVAGDANLLKWWTACRMNWKPTEVKELAGGFTITIGGNDAEGL